MSYKKKPIGPRASRDKSAKLRAYEFMKDGITSGRLPVGEFLTENQIADELGMSRTPVREALQLLERAGFVRVFPKKGAYIPPIDEREVRDVWEARRLIEKYCVARVAASDVDVTSALLALLQLQREDANRQDITAFIEHDREFHFTLVEAAGNRIISEFYGGLRDRQLRMGIQAVLSSPERYQQVIEEHEAIALAVQERDSDKSLSALEAHMQATQQAMRGG